MTFPGFQTRDKTIGLVGKNSSAKNERLDPLQYGATFLRGNRLHEWFANNSRQGAVLTNMGFWLGELSGATGGAHCAIVPSGNHNGGFYVKVTNGGSASLTCTDGYGAVISSGNTQSIYHGNTWSIASGGLYRFSSTTVSSGTPDAALGRASAGVLEVNNATAGTLRDLKLRNLIGTGSLATSIAAKTADYTSTANDGTLTFDATTGNLTCTLETAVGANGRIHVITKIDSSANTVTIDGNASETINGTTTLVLSAQWDKAVIQSDGANWIRIA
jgi:hypothetical protein